MAAVIRANSRSNSVGVARLLGAVALCLVMCACKLSSEELEFKRAQEAVEKNDSETALKHFKSIVDRGTKSSRSMEAAREAARINHYILKRPKDAAEYYRYIVLYAGDASARVDAQKKLADIYLTQILDYQQAITEYSRLLELPHSPQEDFAFRLAIARSYFYLSNFYQAQVEIDGILNRNYDKELVFEALLLKANVFLTSKKLDEAIVTLKRIIDTYPERAKNETIGLVLAVTYEEQKNYAKAIETLESIKDTYPRKAFIEQRIKILRERQTYLPGARGFRK